MSDKRSQSQIYLEQFHRGDTKGLDALVERHLPWIHQQVRHRMTGLLRSKAETWDYAQDAVVQFLRFGPRFQLSDENQLRALLLRIVENTLLNKYDWFMARRRAVSQERPLPAHTVLHLDPSLHSERTPSMSAERIEREAWIRLGLEFLDPEDREVIVLRQWDGLGFTEIGERLDVSKDAARMRHNRAVLKLSEKVQALRSGKLPELLGLDKEG